MILSDQTDATFEMIPIESIIPAEDNPRDLTKDPELVDLAASIKEVGVLQPILVRVHPFEEGSYEILAGHRRFKSAQMACLSSMPCIVSEPEETLRQEIFTVENYHRKGLNPIELAHALQQRADAEKGMSQRDLASRVGISQGHVSKTMSLLKLPEKAQDWVVTGDLSQEDAFSLASLPAPKVKELTDHGRPHSHQIEWAKRAVENEKRVDTARKVAQKAGWTILEEQPHRYIDTQLDGTTPPTGITRGFGALAHVDPTEHEELDCHAVFIRPDGVATPACTRPLDHPAPEVDDEVEEGDGRITVRDVTPPLPKTPGELAVEACQAAMEPSYRRAVDAAGSDPQTTLLLGIKGMLITEDPWGDARKASDLLQLEDPTDDALNDILALLDDLGDQAGVGDSVMAALGIATFAVMLEEVIDAMADGTPLEELEAIDGRNGRVACSRQLIAYLQEVLPDDGIGNLEDLVADFTEVEDSDEPATEAPIPGETDDDEEALPAAAEGDEPDVLAELARKQQKSADAEAARRMAGLKGGEAAQVAEGDGEGPASEDDPPAITVNIWQKGKRYFRTCTVCGQQEGFNTSEADAQTRADLHMVEMHPDALEQAS